jgi:hypothetical protein
MPLIIVLRTKRNEEERRGPKRNEEERRGTKRNEEERRGTNYLLFAD